MCQSGMSPTIAKRHPGMNYARLLKLKEVAVLTNPARATRWKKFIRQHETLDKGIDQVKMPLQAVRKVAQAQVSCDEYSIH